MTSIGQRVRAIESRQGAKEAFLPPLVRIVHPGDTEPEAAPDAGQRVVMVRFLPPGDGDINRNPLQEGK